MPVHLAFTVTKQYRCSYKLCFDSEFRFHLLLYLGMFNFQNYTRYKKKRSFTFLSISEFTVLYLRSG